MLVMFIINAYVGIFVYFLMDFHKGLKVHRATLSYFKWGILPRFTVRERNGRFKGNKVGIFYVATH